ncbi:MAG: hypothetical protein LUE16_03775 [Lachnospiraceae bacterium]|nr:hypothetical protein [Lachnospiraceae bacterium]
MAENNYGAGMDVIREDRPRVSIKFGKRLVGKPFTSKNGKELVEVKIPNQDPADKRSWETFVVSPAMLHENANGKSVWMSLPEDGTTKVSRSVRQGQDENGKTIWNNESRMVSNTELKSMVEAYKEKDRDSVLTDLSAKKTDAAKTEHAAPKRAARPREAAL